MSEEKKIPAIEEEVKSAPLQKLPELKALRESRGLTLEDIFLMTRVSITNLTAIENGEFHLLPAPVYTKRFIQVYADAININAGIILAHYQRYVDEIQAVSEEVEEVKAQITLDRKPFKRYISYAAAIVVIIATAFTMYAFFNEKEPLGVIQHSGLNEAAPMPSTAVKEQSPEAVVEAPQTPPPATVVHEEATQTPANANANANLNLLIEATEYTWLKITEDRNPPYQITLKTGDTLSRKAQEFFIVDVGNAAGVNITFNGKFLGNLGRKGQVVHLRLPQQ